MEIIIQPDAEQASQVAARLFVRQLREKPASVLGLATGGTPTRLYALLAEAHARGEADFARAQSFNLDEYVGLAPDHPASYRRFMQEHLFSRVNLPAAASHVPDGLAADVPAHCDQYEAAIRAAGGIDLQLLGLGADGHLGFNEPGSSLASRTRIKTLTALTREANRRFFPTGSPVPHHVVTMGLGTIMDSRACVLLAFGEGKAEAARLTIEGPVSATVPGSVLQFHPCARVILDEAAASRLSRGDYYRYVYDHKPSWQNDF